ncbi:hypothetical protein [Beijerinckia sp. L45]|uniref:hypothetical protein n=1 Tax=Beijerinckia sp. L45 TaxID=1641855 RepID=UPI00131D25B8|nr:hypothetical protein [Beijerinckia sp. L45]
MKRQVLRLGLAALCAAAAIYLRLKFDDGFGVAIELGFIGVLLGAQAMELA